MAPQPLLDFYFTRGQPPSGSCGSRMEPGASPTAGCSTPCTPAGQRLPLHRDPGSLEPSTSGPSRWLQRGGVPVPLGPRLPLWFPAPVVGTPLCAGRPVPPAHTAGNLWALSPDATQELPRYQSSSSCAVSGGGSASGVTAPPSSPSEGQLQAGSGLRIRDRFWGWRGAATVECWGILRVAGRRVVGAKVAPL